MFPNLMHIVDEIPHQLKNTPVGYQYEGDGFGAAIYRNKAQGLLVLVSLSMMENGEHFLHVSVSRKSRLPSWDDLKRVKNAFIGEDREAVHVLPKQSDYINLHPYCLHLWSEWEG